ncbi:MAG: hypothetical protein AAFU73_17730 [Planctomycetota bacterium]
MLRSLAGRPLAIALLRLAPLALAACSGEHSTVDGIARAESVRRTQPAEGTALDATAHEGTALDAVAVDAPVAPDRVPIERPTGSASPDAEVVVEVLGRDNEPLSGLRVVGCERGADGSYRYSGRFKRGARTGSDGRAVLPKVRAAPLYAAASFGEPVAHSTPAAPTRIVVPVHGTIRLDFREHDASGEVRIGRGSPKKTRSYPFAPGEVVDVLGVPLGQSFLVRVKGEVSSSAERIDGPTEDGETVMHAPPANPLIQVALRLVDEAGGALPVGRTELGPPLHRARLTALDASGGTEAARFEVRALEWAAFAGEEVDLVQRIEPRGGSEPGDSAGAMLSAGRAGRFLVPAWTGEQRVDLGAVSMTTLPLLAGGRVIGPDGEPASGAVVRVQRSADAPVLGRGGGSRTTPGDIGGAWVRTDREGRFEIRARWDAFDRRHLELAVRLAKRRAARGSNRGRSDLDPYAPPAGTVFTRPLTAGDDGVEVVIEAMGTLAVELYGLPKSLLAVTSLSYRARREVAAQELGAGDRASSGVTSTETWLPLPLESSDSGSPRTERVLLEPGRYDVRALYAGSVIALVERVEVVPRGPSPDARIRPLDLMPEIRSGRVVDENGKPIDGARLSVLAASGSWSAVDAGIASYLRGLAAEGEELAPGRVGWPVFEGVSMRLAVTSPYSESLEITDAPDGSVFVLESYVAVAVELPLVSGGSSAGESVAPDVSRAILVIEPLDGGPPPAVRTFERTESDGSAFQVGHVRLPAGARVKIMSDHVLWNDRTFVVPEGGGRVRLQSR